MQQTITKTVQNSITYRRFRNVQYKAGHGRVLLRKIISIRKLKLVSLLAHTAAAEAERTRQTTMLTPTKIKCA